MVFHAAVVVAAGSVVAISADRAPTPDLLVDPRPTSPSTGRLRERWRAYVSERDRSTSGRTGLDRIGTAGADRRCLAVAAVGAVVVIATAGPTLAPFGLLLVATLTWSWRRRVGRRQIGVAVAQLADLVRFLANATEAGLSLRAAMSRAGEAVPAPLGPIIAGVAHDLELGAPLAEALSCLSATLPGAEVRFLVSTLVVQQRSGGDVVSALRRMAVGLAERAAVREEMRTQLGAASASASAVVALGVGALAMTVAASDGAWDEMTASTSGQLAIVAATGLYLLGYWMIGRISRVDR